MKHTIRSTCRLRSPVCDPLHMATRSARCVQAAKRTASRRMANERIASERQPDEWQSSKSARHSRQLLTACELHGCQTSYMSSPSSITRLNERISQCATTYGPQADGQLCASNFSVLFGDCAIQLPHSLGMRYTFLFLSSGRMPFLSFGDSIFLTAFIERSVRIQ